MGLLTVCEEEARVFSEMGVNTSGAPGAHYTLTSPAAEGHPHEQDCSLYSMHH